MRTAPTGPGRRPRRLLARSGLLALVLLAVSGCSTENIPDFGMPEPITEQGHQVIALWKGAWLAAWAVGILVWGLIGWCIVAYRKRSNELPPQVHYNLPIEILYTIIPVVIIAILFYFTAVDEENIDELKTPEMSVSVVGYQWAWQFGYEDGPAQGLLVHGRVGQFPQLVVPTGERVRFKLSSPDVIHAFWIPNVDFKRDVIPGRLNQFDLTFTKEGTFRGFCTELCGVDHDRMLFTLRTVSPTEFKTWATTTVLKARTGQTGNRFTYVGAER